MDKNRPGSYPDLGVEFIFPKSLSHVGVIKLNSNEPEGRGSFEPKRHIISVLLYNTETYEEMTDFGEEGFDIKVEFMAIDLENVEAEDEEEALRTLALGYYDARKCDFRWVTFRLEDGDYPYKERPIKYPKAKGKWIGYAVVNIKRWDDPEMAWGP